MPSAYHGLVRGIVVSPAGPFLDERRIGRAGRRRAEVIDASGLLVLVPVPMKQNELYQYRCIHGKFTGGIKSLK